MQARREEELAQEGLLFCVFDLKQTVGGSKGIGLLDSAAAAAAFRLLISLVSDCLSCYCHTNRNVVRTSYSETESYYPE